MRSFNPDRASQAIPTQHDVDFILDIVTFQSRPGFPGHPNIRSPLNRVLLSVVSSAMMLCLREANENRPRPLAHAAPLPGMTASACHVLAYTPERRIGYTRSGGNETRSSGFGAPKPVFQADPGASRRAACHHGSWP